MSGCESTSQNLTSESNLPIASVRPPTCWTWIAWLWCHDNSPPIGVPSRFRRHVVEEPHLSSCFTLELVYNGGATVYLKRRQNGHECYFRNQAVVDPFGTSTCTIVHASSQRIGANSCYSTTCKLLAVCSQLWHLSNRTWQRLRKRVATERLCGSASLNHNTIIH